MSMGAQGMDKGVEEKQKYSIIKSLFYILIRNKNIEKSNISWIL